MRKILFLFLSFFVLQNVSGQCPDNAILSNNTHCITLTWNTAPSAYPSSIVYVGVGTYNFESSSGTTRTYLRRGNCGGGASTNLTGTITYTIVDTIYTCRYEVGSLAEQTLPIDLLTFNTTLQTDKSVLVYWTYANAIDFERFGVEHSTDGRSWTEIGSIDLPAFLLRSNELSYTHRNPMSGHNYYRLRMIDLDGTFSLSDVQQVFIESEQLIHLVNTTVHTNVLIQRGNNDEDTHLMIYDLSGKSVHRSNLPSGESTIHLDVSGLTPGMYILHATSLQRKEAHKIMKVQ